MGHDGKILDAHSVRFERLLPGPIELAWDYLTKPELLKTWFAEVSLQPRLGGAVEITMGADETGDCDASSVSGVIREFSPPHVVAFSWLPRRQRKDGSVEAVDEGEVRFELASRGEQVLLILTHTRIPTSELAGYGGGWHAFLDALEARIHNKAAVQVGAIYGDLHKSYEAAVAAVTRSGAA
ncbi:MAG TPA: SRPBCC family protein [Dongiaceae bacterium]|nr:SRPBCC family protein [Dongiaceae bacterium]